MDGLVGSGSRRRIGIREVRDLGPGQIVWDAAVTGFCARRQRGEAVTYMVFYRTAQGRQRWYRIGRAGSPWTPDDARQEALRILGEVVRGGDPAADRQVSRAGVAVTMTVLCDRYLADAEAGRLLTRRRVPKTSSTIATDRSRMNAHIRPILGAIPVAALTRDDVERLMHAIVAGTTRKRMKLPKAHAVDCH